MDDSGVVVVDNIAGSGVPKGFVLDGFSVLWIFGSLYMALTRLA